VPTLEDFPIDPEYERRALLSEIEAVYQEQIRPAVLHHSRYKGGLLVAHTILAGLVEPFHDGERLRFQDQSAQLRVDSNIDTRERSAVLSFWSDDGEPCGANAYTLHPVPGPMHPLNEPAAHSDALQRQKLRRVIWVPTMAEEVLGKLLVANGPNPIPHILPKRS
jgi:hypothetical protein